ncbi:hypothetical protein M8C13_39660 [Crossiella sp. SN42]|uniref:hypothetical protein n=1 Tax=Crossiella sp. SN42 TaxID=2944808 RepID=UPI00207C8F1D|nr:hypothetical protein [Crossiella sp. SN42]MCO1581883.1 hypothetical protein [Crossiella sp. SN42]
MVAPNPEFRQLVRALVEGQWREPVVAIHLGDVGPNFDVPGRRKDGTVKGKRLIRRFFWNLIRVPIGGVVSLFLSVLGGGVANMFERSGSVRGPANARALGLVEAAMAAENAWLVFSPSHVGVVDTGPSFGTPADNGPPALRWHEAAPHGPRVKPYQQELVWPDGSEFRFHVTAEERAILKQG